MPNASSLALLAAALCLPGAPALAQSGTTQAGRGESMSNAERREAQVRCDTLAPGTEARNRCLDDLALNRNETARNARDAQRAGSGSRSDDPRLAEPSAAERITPPGAPR